MCGKISEKNLKIIVSTGHNTMKKISKIRENDILLGAGLLLGAMCLWCVIYFAGRNMDKNALTIVITVDGQEYYTGSLIESGAGENNTGSTVGNKREIDVDGHNKVVIADGEVWMESADCPDKLCISQGKISKTGQTIICLPNKTMVTIKGGKSEYDGVAQ